MKRAIFAVLVVSLAIAPVAAQIRLDAGVMIPRGVGLTDSGGTSTFDEFNAVMSKFIIPLPEAGLYYQCGAGPVRLGAGVRVFTFILISAFYPNAFAEIDFGPVTLMGQMGGGFFGVFGLVSESTTGKVFFPELSLWYRFGEAFRLGVGAIGIFLPELTSDTIPFMWYLGGKFSFVFE
ncbi:MAG TPA: hypothetical protein PKW82_03565 [Spirochaetales bacterium]|nr:hypothetical protein [Spirochaetales bacterium]